MLGWLFAWLLGFHAALFSDGSTPIALNVAPSESAPAAARACGACHEEIYAQWARSRHAVARTNPQFLASYRIEPMRWCINCHAPLATAADANDALANDGVNCATCHVRDGVVLTSQPATAAALAAHPLRIEPQLAAASFCAACHQFNWPATRVPFRYGPHPMQNTFAEWQARDTPAQPCQRCHMREGHEMGGGHDVALLRKTVTVTVAWPTADHARVTLAARDVGHHMPTGDPFHRFVVELCDTETCEAAAGVLVRDTTVAPGGKQLANVALDESFISGDSLYWRLVYRWPAMGANVGLTREEQALEISHGSVTRGK